MEDGSSGSEQVDPILEARRSAMRDLAGRDLLASELAERLARDGHAAEAASKVVEALRDRGLLDDDRTLRTRVSRWRREGRSSAVIRARLEAAGVAPEVADRLADTVGGLEEEERPPESAAAIEAIRRRSRGLDPTSPMDLRRLVGRLSSAGFEPDTIRWALRQCGFDEGSLDETAP